MSTQEKGNNDRVHFSQLFEQARLTYNFATLMVAYSNNKNASTIAPELTVTEVHLLIDIMDNPGIRISELGRMNKKTRGAISQMVSRLEAAGMLSKSVSEQHGSKRDLKLTELGTAVAKEHVDHDIRSLTQTLNRLMEKCSMEEIEHFYKVIECYNDILQEEENNDRS